MALKTNNVLEIRIPPVIDSVDLMYSGDRTPSVWMRHKFATFSDMMTKKEPCSVVPQVASRCIAIKADSNRCGVTREFAEKLEREGRGKRLDSENLCVAHRTWITDRKPIVLLRTPVLRQRSA